MTDEPEVQRVRTALLLPDGSCVAGEFLVLDFDPGDPDHSRVALRFGDRELASSDQTDWEALCSLREQLEGEGLRVLCYGASRNVHPSGMSHGMGSGDMAYRLTLGKRAGTKDLVWIFNTGPEVIPATVAEQESFYQEWLETPKSDQAE